MRLNIQWRLIVEITQKEPPKKPSKKTEQAAPKHIVRVVRIEDYHH